ncbi:MAG: ABC transporter ATP-binding protein [Eubacterium sp.]|nr:ABC transporter ATP-binding protein [Eubacterium sp.]
MLQYIKDKAYFTWLNLLNWIRENNNGSVGSYLLKVFVAMIVFIVINDILKKVFEKIGSKISGLDETPISVQIALGFIRSVILIFILTIIMSQLMIVEVSPVASIAIASGIVILFVIQDVLPKALSKLTQVIFRSDRGNVVVNGSDQLHMYKVSEYNQTGRKVRQFVRYASKFAGFIVAALIVFIGYEGVVYLMNPSGKDISNFLDKPEKTISTQLDTKFMKSNKDVIKEVPLLASGDVGVRSDGDLNIIYVSGKQVGINTKGKKYKFFNVEINQSAKEAENNMTYKYEKSKEILKDMLGGVSDSYIYYNEKENTGLVLTINAETNKVRAITYYPDLKAVTKSISIDQY